jgi:hypothetical protein
MNYKLIKDYQETWYYEFCPGKYDSNDPKYNSVYIGSEAWAFIGGCAGRANNNFNYDTITEYTKEKGQIQLLTEELKMTLAKIIEDKYLPGLSGESGDVAANALNKYKAEIVTMIGDLIEWLENLEENELTIIPPFDKLSGMILKPE